MSDSSRATPAARRSHHASTPRGPTARRPGREGRRDAAPNQRRPVGHGPDDGTRSPSTVPGLRRGCRPHRHDDRRRSPSSPVLRAAAAIVLRLDGQHDQVGVRIAAALSSSVRTPKSRCSRSSCAAGDRPPTGPRCGAAPPQARRPGCSSCVRTDERDPHWSCLRSAARPEHGRAHPHDGRPSSTAASRSSSCHGQGVERVPAPVEIPSSSRSRRNGMRCAASSARGGMHISPRRRRPAAGPRVGKPGSSAGATPPCQGSSASRTEQHVSGPAKGAAGRRAWPRSLASTGVNPLEVSRPSGS